MKKFSEFVDAVYKAQANTTKGVTKVEVEEVIRLIGDVVSNMKDDDKIRLFNHKGYVGKFVLTTLAAKKGVSGTDHKQWSKPERKVIEFRAKPTNK